MRSRASVKTSYGWYERHLAGRDRSGSALPADRADAPIVWLAKRIAERAVLLVALRTGVERRSGRAPVASFRTGDTGVRHAGRAIRAAHAAAHGVKSCPTSRVHDGPGLLAVSSTMVR